MTLALRADSITHRAGLRRALSSVLRGRSSIRSAAKLHRVPLRALRRLVRAGRMPW
jgi:hypothetical protein